MDSSVLLIICIVMVCMICSSISSYFGWKYFGSQNKSDGDKSTGENDFVTFLKKFATSQKVEKFTIPGTGSTDDNWDQIMEIWEFLKKKVIPKEILQNSLKCDNLTRDNIRNITSCVFEQTDFAKLDDAALGILWVTLMPMSVMMMNKTFLLSDILEYNPETQSVNIKLDIVKNSVQYKPVPIQINGKNINVLHLPRKDENPNRASSDSIGNQYDLFDKNQEIGSTVLLDVTYNGTTKQIPFRYSKTASLYLSRDTVNKLNIDLSQYEYDYTKVPIKDLVEVIKAEPMPTLGFQECTCSVLARRH